MAKLTAKQVTEKHARRLKGAVEDMRIGVENVSVNPMEKAIKKIPKMRANLIRAIDEGKVERGMKRVSLDDWKTAMVDRGIPRVAAGVDAAANKIEEFYGELLPHIDKVKTEVARLPDVSLEDSINRMSTFIRGMAKFKRRG